MSLIVLCLAKELTLSKEKGKKINNDGCDIYVRGGIWENCFPYIFRQIHSRSLGSFTAAAIRRLDKLALHLKSIPFLLWAKGRLWLMNENRNEIL
jgi:hypothetical protein